MGFNHYMKMQHAGWRISLGLQVLFGFTVAIGLFFVKETPRFLQSCGKTDEALKVLSSLRGSEAVARVELDAVKREIEEEQAAGEAVWSEIFTNPLFCRLVTI